MGDRRNDFSYCLKSLVFAGKDWRFSQWSKLPVWSVGKNEGPRFRRNWGGWPILSRRLRKGGAAFRWPASVFHPSLGGRPSHRFPLPQDVARQGLVASANGFGSGAAASETT